MTDFAVTRLCLELDRSHCGWRPFGAEAACHRLRKIPLLAAPERPQCIAASGARRSELDYLTAGIIYLWFRTPSGTGSIHRTEAALCVLASTAATGVNASESMVAMYLNDLFANPPIASSVPSPTARVRAVKPFYVQLER